MLIGNADILSMGYVFPIFFSTFMILSPAPQKQVAYAGGKSPYESGYDHDCDDARNFNQKEAQVFIPSIHARIL
jgi:hypothetical protein